MIDMIIVWRFFCVEVLRKNCLKRGHGCTAQNTDLIEGLVWDLDWNFMQPTEKSSGLFWTHAKPMLYPCQPELLE